MKFIWMAEWIDGWMGLLETVWMVVFGISRIVYAQQQFL